MILGAPTLSWLLGFNLLLLTSGWPWIRSAPQAPAFWKALMGAQLLWQKFDAGPLRLFTCLSLSVSTKYIFQGSIRLHQPSQERGILEQDMFCLNFRMFWVLDQRLKISSHECSKNQQKPDVMMFGSFDRREKAPLQWHLVHTEGLLWPPMTEIKCTFSSHNGFWTHLKCSCTQAFLYTVDTIQVQSFPWSDKFSDDNFWCSKYGFLCLLQELYAALI